ncbi:MAG: flagellar protein FlaG [Gammaproteobacteria bacterium]|nr:flagellar protein FlaG [Gammaproteobacteria bacterium]
MSAPISSVDFGTIQLPDGGPTKEDGGSYGQHSVSGGFVADTHSVKSRQAESAESQAASVQVRLQEAGSNVRVGVELVNGSTVFTVRNADTGQIIRKIPSDEAIRISQNLDKLTGLYLDRLE